MLFLLLACASPTPDSAEPVVFCEGELDYRYAPDEAFHTFPDDHWTS